MSSRSIRIALLGLHLALPANAKLRGEDDEATAMMLTDIKKKMENAGEYMTDKFMNAGEYLENQLGNDDEFDKNLNNIGKKFQKLGKKVQKKGMNAGVNGLEALANDNPNHNKVDKFGNKIAGWAARNVPNDQVKKMAADHLAQQAEVNMNRRADEWDKKVQDLMDKHGKKAGIVAAIAIAATVAYQYRAPLWRAIKKASRGIKKGAVALKNRILKPKQTTKLT